MSLSFHIPENLDRRAPHVWLASWFGCGFFSPAPGTWGSLGAIPFGIGLFLFGGLPVLLIAILCITLIGLWAAHKFDQDMDGHDSKMIVIDEVAGQWIALIPATLNPVMIILAFILFRMFDIAKPWPVSFFDKKVPGAWGVMGDDIVAGLMAAFGLIVLGGLL